MPKVKVISNIQTNQIKLEVDGVVGEGCTDLTLAFENAMGSITTTEKKRDFYALNEEQNYN